MAAHAAVRVDDDFASGQTGVRMRTTRVGEATCAVDDQAVGLGEKFGWNGVLDHVGAQGQDCQWRLEKQTGKLDSMGSLGVEQSWRLEKLEARIDLLGTQLAAAGVIEKLEGIERAAAENDAPMDPELFARMKERLGSDEEEAQAPAET